MPLLEDTTRNKIIQDYLDNAQTEPDLFSERYSNNPDDDIWGTGRVYKLDMGIALGAVVDPFNPNDPLLTDEPNDAASATDYDLATLGGWLVTVGSNPQYTYRVRRASSGYRLRDAAKSAETTYHNDAGGKQVRTTDNGLRHMK